MPLLRVQHKEEAQEKEGRGTPSSLPAPQGGGRPRRSSGCWLPQLPLLPLPTQGHQPLLHPGLSPARFGDAEGPIQGVPTTTSHLSYGMLKITKLEAEEWVT